MNAGNKNDIKDEALKRAIDGVLFAHFGSDERSAAGIMERIMSDFASDESKRRAMEGVLTVSVGFGSGAANRGYFTSNVMNEIRAFHLSSGEVPSGGRKSVFAVRILSLAASFLVLLGVVGMYFMTHYNGDTKIKPASRPCLLTSTPGGLLERNMKQSAIDNGMPLENNDIIRTYAGSCSFVIFSDLSRIEIGGGSVIEFSDVSALNTGKGMRLGDRKMRLHEGVVDADMSGAKNHGTFKVFLPGGELRAQDARFIAAISNSEVFVEVTRGSVSIKSEEKSGTLMVVEAGRCLVLSREGISKLPAEESQTGDRFAELKKRLSLSESKFEELLVNFQKRKKVDICLKMPQGSPEGAARITPDFGRDI